MDTTLLSANASLSAFQRAQYECIEQRPTFARFLIDPRPHTELDHSARRPGPNADRYGRRRFART